MKKTPAPKTTTRTRIQDADFAAKAKQPTRQQTMAAVKRAVKK